ncbi:MAG: MBL fold metallo-hydrolase [Thermodesulfobacteriota bacterium]|nr:MBL fold metallo-hydrolase [Thermodesulfobacteriota bacterium]
MPDAPQFSVTILGSGTCVPSLARSACSLVVETTDSKVLFDCGPGTMHRLLAAGITIFELSHVFFSHFHPDHTGEMAAFLFANKYAMPPQRTFPLVMGGGGGFSGFYEGLKHVYGDWLVLEEGLLSIREFDVAGSDGFDAGDFSISTMPMTHRPESIGFRLSSGGRSMVYSGDTDMDKNLVSLARDADLLVCEAAMPDAMKVPGHLTPCLAGEIAEKANVGELVLTHFYPDCEKVDIAKECRRAYSGKLRLATDLMRIDLTGMKEK